ncbi:hypothetical protein [Porticoccus sp.]
MPNHNQQGLLGQIFGDKYTKSTLGGILGKVGNAAQSFNNNPASAYFAARAGGADPSAAMLGKQRAQAYQTAIAYQEEQRQREAEEYKRQQEAAAQAEAQNIKNRALLETIAEQGTGFLGKDRQQQNARLLGYGVDPGMLNSILGKEQAPKIPQIGQLMEYEAQLRAQGNTQDADMVRAAINKQTHIPSGDNPNSLFGTPILTTDDKGIYVNQIGKGGGLHPVPLPEGQRYYDPYSKAYDTKAGQGHAEQDTVAGVEQAKVEGKARGEEIVGAPGRSDSLDMMTNIVNGLMGNKSLDSVYGTLEGALPTMRQSTVDAESGVDKLVALLSLDARTKLKGQGTISDFEGKMLEKAVAKLSNKRISAAEARAELEVIYGVLSAARSRLPTSSAGQPTGSAGQQPPPPPSGNGWSIEE